MVADAVVRAGNFTVAGWIDDVNPGRTGELFQGVPILGGREHLPRLVAEGTYWLVVAVGGVRGPRALGESGDARRPTAGHHHSSGGLCGLCGGARAGHVRGGRGRGCAGRTAGV